MFALVALAACTSVPGALFKTLPGGFLPEEDQGVFISSVRLPDGASIERNVATSIQVENVLEPRPAYRTFRSSEVSISRPPRTTQMSVTVFATLKPWDERKAKNVQFESILGSVQQSYYGIKDGFTFAFGLPPILGLGTSGGFEFMLEDRSGGDIDALAEAADQLVSSILAAGPSCKM